MSGPCTNSQCEDIMDPQFAAHCANPSTTLASAAPVCGCVDLTEFDRIADNGETRLTDDNHEREID